MSFEEVPEEPEHVPARPVMWTIGGTILGIGACVFVVWALRAFQLTGGGRSDVAAAQSLELVPPAQPFSMPMRPMLRRMIGVDELDRWTWADRRAGVVRHPVEVAIERDLQTRGGGTR